MNIRFVSLISSQIFNMQFDIIFIKMKHDSCVAAQVTRIMLLVDTVCGYQAIIVSENMLTHFVKVFVCIQLCHFN